MLLALEVPLGVQNQRSERRDLEAKVTRDATVLAQDAEDAVQSRKPARARGRWPRIAYDYAQRDATRAS